MEIITRKQAMALGLKEYFPGSKCKHGHISLRQMPGGSCLGCRRNGRPSELVKYTCDPRPPIIDGEIAVVPLTKGKVAIIDACDVERVRQYNWFAHRTRGTGKFYAATNVERNGKRTVLHLHRFLTREIEGLIVDHGDGNGLNNRRANLRVCDYSQNGANRPAQRNNKLGIKGVCAFRNGFLATIMRNRKSKSLGVFRTRQGASAAYKSAAEDVFGEFAFKGEPTNVDD